MHLQDLPLEILLNILSFLQLTDILELSRVSTFFKTVGRENFVWRMLARRDYKAVVPDSNPRELYRHFYHKYGRLVGVYRLYTFFSKHLLHIGVDPENCRYILMRTWPLEVEGEGAKKGRDVLRIYYQDSDTVVGQCLEGNEEDKTFCFNDHLGGEKHHFRFHFCKNNLFFNPLKGDHDFMITFCPQNRCLSPEFTKVVCCQKISTVGQQGGIPTDKRRIIKSGIFTRYHHNANQNRSHLGPDTFFTLETTRGVAPVLSISQFTSQHEVCCASLLMPCDLANMSRGSLLAMETPAFDVDHLIGKPFPWCEVGIRNSISGVERVRHWPKLYKAAYFDVANTVFIVLFDGRTVGCFFSDGTCDLLERFDFI